MKKQRRKAVKDEATKLTKYGMVAGSKFYWLNPISIAALTLQ
jgi:hypothetical protein